jgi:acyl dehydratase
VSAQEKRVQFAQVQVGDALPPLTLLVTPSVIVAGAMASGDFEPVHHDVPGARARGTPDIFMNILTTNGYVQRFVNDWAGPAGRIRSISFRLGVPSYAGDTLRFTGMVRAKSDTAAEPLVEVAVTGNNSLGEHVAATVQVALP